MARYFVVCRLDYLKKREYENTERYLKSFGIPVPREVETALKTSTKTVEVFPTNYGTFNLSEYDNIIEFRIEEGYVPFEEITLEGL
jgi:hypothetical protein